MPASPVSELPAAPGALGVAPPPEVAFADAWAGMSPMARSFWSDNRKVSSQATKAALGLSWLYPTYREGLRNDKEGLANFSFAEENRFILAEERTFLRQVK